MKIGLFGGSFDPIHNGHILPVREARRTLGLDRVIYLPTAVPPHKPGKQFAPAHARYAMVEMALLEEEGFFASSHELTLGRPAYTIETLEHFQREFAGADLYLIIGGDSFSDLHHWVRWREIPRLARLVVMARPGWDLETADLDPETVDLARSDRVQLLQQPPFDISSTRLRELFAAGEPIPDGVMSNLVVRYVHKYDLYR